MGAVFTPTRYKLSVSDYHKLGEASVLSADCRVELIEGELINMAPIGAQHASTLDTLIELLQPQAQGRFRLSAQNPLRLEPNSEPQPDLMLLKPRGDRYAAALPCAADVLLLVEVADKTADYDRSVKAVLYAQHAVVEYWIVDISARRVEVYREPEANGYTRKLSFGVADVISPVNLPQVKLEIEKLL